MPSDEPVVVTQNLTKKYGEIVALDGLSLTLHRGQILGLIGPNGAGKTTAIRILVGLARPTSGSAHIAGADCYREARRIKRLVGYMPDQFGSYDNMRVREYLDFFGAAFGIRRRKRTARISEVLDLVNAGWMQDRFVESLSHGMQQRIGLARTLLHDPQVLILDEPANGLDPEARVEMREILLQLAAMGKTLIVTSHILPELSRICHRVAIITKGRLRAFGPLDEIMRRVTQQRRIEVQLPTSDRLEEAASALARLAPEASDITTHPAEAVIRFRSAMTEARMSEVLAGLVQAGIEIAQFRELQTDLEDAFLSVTREDVQTDGEARRSPAAVADATGGRS
jgi:ABC-2 type transport system ATP-binding protein